MRRFSLVLPVIMLAGCSAARVPSAFQEPATAAAYKQLLALYPEDHQGLGKDNYLGTVEEQPMTYGLVLSAEAARYRGTHADESRRRMQKAMQWLLANSDLDGDGKPGWGLPQPWDAFQDGTTNPPNQPYTITTAIVLNGMLDSLPLPIWSYAQTKQIRELAGKVAVRWCREMWSDGFTGGYFWYSPSPADDIFAVNSPSMFMGSLARLLREQPDALKGEDRALVQRRADAQAQAVVATVILRKGLPFWDYMPQPNKFNRQTPNDLVHHVYTLWGIETYRDCGGRVALPWTREQARQSLEVFWKDGHICEYPQDVAYGAAQKAYIGRPSILWGAGSLLAGYAEWGDRAGAARTLAAILRDYGTWPQLVLRPESASTRPASETSPFYARQAAHVLWGLGLYAFENHATGCETCGNPLAR